MSSFQSDNILMTINYKLKNWTILKVEVKRLLLTASPTEKTWLSQALIKMESNIQQAKERREKVRMYFISERKWNKFVNDTYRSVLSKWEFFIKMRAAFLLSPSSITWGRMGASKAALISMKNSHFDRILQYIVQVQPNIKRFNATHLKPIIWSKQQCFISS